MADADADAVLRICPRNVRGLINKAEMQYNMGNFEHAMKYFHRANVLRPGYHGVGLGVKKARDAIENSLSKAKGFSFAQMEEAIVMIEEQERKEEERRQADYFKRLGAGNANSFHISFYFKFPHLGMGSDGNMQTIDQKVKMKRARSDTGGEDGDDEAEVDDADDAESVDSLAEEEEERKRREEEGGLSNYPKILMEIPPELEGLWDPTAEESEEGEEGKMKDGEDGRRLKRAATEDSSQRAQRCNGVRGARGGERALKKANKTLLGELHGDQMYLQQLLVNPQLAHKEMGDAVQRRVKNCAEEALKYLEARKDFWQQQKPVYARKNESILKKRGKLFKARKRNSMVF